MALDSAAQIIFLIDGRTEITGADRDLAKMLRQLGKPVTLAVNKIDTTARESLAHEFHALGFADLFPISAEHRIGFDDLLDHVTQRFSASGEAEEAAAARSAADQGRHHRPAERGQIDAAECAGRLGARHRFAGRRHHARRRG